MRTWSMRFMESDDDAWWSITGADELNAPELATASSLELAQFIVDACNEKEARDALGWQLKRAAIAPCGECGTIGTHICGGRTTVRYRGDIFEVT